MTLLFKCELGFIKNGKSKLGTYSFFYENLLEYFYRNLVEQNLTIDAEICDFSAVVFRITVFSTLQYVKLCRGTHAWFCNVDTYTVACLYN